MTLTYELELMEFILEHCLYHGKFMVHFDFIFLFYSGFFILNKTFVLAFFFFLVEVSFKVYVMVMENPSQFT